MDKVLNDSAIQLNPMITCNCLIGRNATKETACQAVGGVRQIEELLQL
jgi:hypothetical protein